jgi:hypothetical protein
MTDFETRAIEIMHELMSSFSTSQQSVWEAAKKLDSLHQAEVKRAEEAQYLTRSDLNWCLGKLRGLGYPAEQLEKQYDFEQRLAIRGQEG